MGLFDRFKKESKKEETPAPTAMPQQDKDGINISMTPDRKESF